MDKYIKSKKDAIAAEKKSILCKYAYILLILMYVPIVSLGFLKPSPKTWITTDVVFSHISRMELAFGPVHKFHTEDGKEFQIIFDDMFIENVEKQLVCGQTYYLTYSTDPITGANKIEALSDENIIFQNLNDSMIAWKNNRKLTGTIIFVILGIASICFGLIDRIWCKTEHSRIKRLEEDITRWKIKRGL